MAESKLKALRPVILIFLIVVIGAAFITANANTLSPSVQTQSIGNETFNFGGSGRIAADAFSINTSKVYTIVYTPLATSNLSTATFTLTNASGTPATVTTDYVFNANNGTFFLKNTTFWFAVTSNTSKAAYSYYANGYITDGGTRSVLSLTDFFTTLGVLLVIAGYLYRSEIFEYFTED